MTVAAIIVAAGRGLRAGEGLPKQFRSVGGGVLIPPACLPAYPPGGYDPYWNRVTSPKPGIFCYPAQYACYTANGSFSPKWTSRMY